MHCHFQIEYTGICPDYGGKIQFEDLVGFNPAKNKDRELIHSCLDEYLDYLQERMRITQEWRDDSFKPLHEDNRFMVFDDAD